MSCGTTRPAPPHPVPPPHPAVKEDAKSTKPQARSGLQGSPRRPANTFARPKSRPGAADTSAGTAQSATESACSTTTTTTTTVPAVEAVAAGDKGTGTGTNTNTKGKRLLPSGELGDCAATPRSTKNPFFSSGGKEGAPDTPSPETDREQSPMVCVEGARRSQDAVVSGTLVVDVDSEDCPGRAGATDESGGLAECGDEACGKGRRADGKEQAGVPREEGRRCRPKRGTGGRREELKVELVWKARGNRPAARTGGTRAGRCGGEKERERQSTGISEYELKRLERIKKNQAFMATLGLDSARPVAPLSATASAHGGGASKSRKRKSKPLSRARERAPAVPVRRSARARGAEAVDYSEDKQAIFATSLAPSRKPEPEPEPVLEETDFDDSTVLKYLCGQVGGSGGGDGATSTKTATEGAGRVVSLRVLDPRRPLSASGLSTIYTMHFCRGGAAGGGGRGGNRRTAVPSLLAAGGKGGVVALFSTQRSQDNEAAENAELEEEEEDERTLMNFKAHKGWVSAVRFLNSGDGGGGGGGGDAYFAGCRLLSSANDSVVKLWDTAKQHRGSPRLLCTADDLHPTRKGIFSMDSYGTRVATGSKDTTVAVASVTPTGMSFDRVLGDCGGSQAFHEKVVKGVSLRDESTVASCGDDSNVRVSDLRSPSFFGVSHRLDGVHSGPCHSVRWHPRDANLLLTAGLDSTVKLHDLRRLDAPLHVFRGHCPYALPRPRAIHRPEFFPAGRGGFNIITCGERSEKLSMYDAANGATVSRGVLGDEASPWCSTASAAEPTVF
eukprot:jgi/Undpi1/4867/HiC_scaffold_19.g08220.m1